MRVALVAAAAAALSLLLASDAWAPERAFSVRFTTNDTGNIAIVGNTLQTCPSSASTCSQAQAGTASGTNLNNNSYSMVRVDADGDSATTLDSSRATLTLPAGATVLFAGLYFGAETTAGTGGQPSPNSGLRNTVKLKLPGASAYTTLTASTFDELTSIAARPYQGFVDVTDRVATAGNGDYWAGDVQSATGNDRFAGWALVVAYRDTAQPARNLTVFDGYAAVTAGVSNVVVDLGGFKTPPVGPVRTTLGAVVHEGDAGSTGDSLTLNTTTLSDATNPANNFFNSTISSGGVLFTAKDPNYVNQLGFDANLVNADGILPNGATDARITLKTSSEQYFPGVVTFATELFAPSVDATKSVTDLDGGQAERGDTLRYAVSFANSGQDGASGFVGLDLVPVGTTYVPGSLRILTGPGAGAQTDAAGDDLGEFDAGLNSVVFRLGQGATASTGGVLTAAGGAASSTSISFDVTIDGDVADGFRVVDQARADFQGQSLGSALTAESNQVETVVAAPDLTLTKTHSGSIVGGATTPFTITVSNAGTGPTDGSTVTISDTFPASAFTSISVASSPGWDCSGTSGLVLDCTRTSVLAGGASYPPIVVNAVVANPVPAAVLNTAAVAGGGDSDPTNNHATDVGPGTNAADLAVAKTVSESAVPSGGQVDFELVVTNAGPSTADNVTLTDTLGSDYTNVSAGSSQGSCTTAVVCTIGSLAPGSSATVTIHATLTANDTTLTNTATVASSTPDPVGSNNSASADVVVQPTTDLVIEKTAKPSPTAGLTDDGVYTITVRNAGPLDATNVGVVDTIPADFTPTSVTAPGFTCNLPGAGGELSCRRPTLTVADGTLTITIVGTFAPASAGTVVMNGALGTADQAELNPADNSAVAETVPIPAADLDLAKSVSASPIDSGDNVTFTLTLVNHGPSPAVGVTVTDTLPSGLTFVSASAECTFAGGVVTCSVATMASGETNTFTITAKAAGGTAGQSLTNNASASSSTPDPVDTNNTAVASVEVSSPSPPPPPPPPEGTTTTSTTPVAPTAAQPDLVATKVVSPTTASVGQDVTFQLAVTNKGSGPATGVVLTDPMPPGFTVVSAGSGCAVGPPLTCSVGSLGPGESHSFSVVARPTAAASGRTLTNIVTASAAEPDQNPSDDSAQATITVGGLADLSVRKSVSPNPLVVGRRAVYTMVVTNHGPNDATDAELHDSLPSRLVPVSVTPSQPTCIISGKTVACKLGKLASGSSAQVTVVVAVARRPARSPLVNSARVESAETDPHPADNVARSTAKTVAAGGEVDLTVRKTALERSAHTDEPVHYRIVITNRSTTTANHVRVTDALSQPVSLVSAQISTGSCGTRLPLACGIDHLQPDTSATIRLAVTPLRPGTLADTASVRADQLDPRLRNNQTVVKTHVAAARAVLQVTKTVRERETRPGAVIHYAVSVRSVGGAAALGLQVCDRLPGDQVYVSARGAAFRAGQACWTVRRLPPGATRRFTVTAIADRSATTHASTNGVRVTSANAPTISGDAGVRVIGGPVVGRPGGAGG